MASQRVDEMVDDHSLDLTTVDLTDLSNEDLENLYTCIILDRCGDEWDAYAYEEPCYVRAEIMRRMNGGQR